MRDTISNRNALNEMVKACEGTHYRIRIHELTHSEGKDIIPILSRDEDAPEYTPSVYLEDELWLSGGLRIEVQTTSYGALNVRDITAVAEGLMEAAQLAGRISEIAAAHGIPVHG